MKTRLPASPPPTTTQRPRGAEGPSSTQAPRETQRTDDVKGAARGPVESAFEGVTTSKTAAPIVASGSVGSLASQLGALLASDLSALSAGEKRDAQRMLTELQQKLAVAMAGEAPSTSSASGSAAAPAMTEAAVGQRVDELFEAGRFAELVPVLAARVEQLSVPHTTLSHEQLLANMASLHVLQHQLIGTLNGLSRVEHPKEKDLALSLLRDVGEVQSELFQAAVDRGNEREPDKAVHPWAVFKDTMKKPGHHTRDERLQYFQARAAKFLDEGGSLAAIKPVTPEVLKGYPSGRLLEFVVDAFDTPRLTDAETEPTAGHTLLAMGNDALAAGTLRLFKNEQGEIESAVIGTFSGHFRTPASTLSHMARHLVAAGVDPEKIVLQGGEAGSARGMEVLQRTMGLSGAEIQREQARLDALADRYSGGADDGAASASDAGGARKVVDKRPAEVRDPVEVFGPPPPDGRRTRIVATINPKATDVQLRDMIRAGLDVARFNSAHATPEELEAVMARVRLEAEKLGREVRIQLDISGPKIRLGKFENPENLEYNDIWLKTGDTVQLSSADKLGTPTRLPVDLESLGKDVKPGDRLFMNDGLVELRIEKVGQDAEGNALVDAKVVQGGKVWDRKGINMPDSNLSLPTVTDEDLKYLDVLADDLDLLAVSFARKPEDILYAREQLRARGVDIPIIAKIERPEALANLETIAAVSDALMVARGDLGVEIGRENVPPAERRINALGNRLGKPTMVATEVLMSMAKGDARASRGDVEALYSAVYDQGADAVMLGKESSFPEKPGVVVREAALCIGRAELDLANQDTLALAQLDA